MFYMKGRVECGYSFVMIYSKNNYVKANTADLFFKKTKHIFFPIYFVY